MQRVLRIPVNYNPDASDAVPSRRKADVCIPEPRDNIKKHYY